MGRLRIRENLAVALACSLVSACGDTQPSSTTDACAPSPTDGSLSDAPSDSPSPVTDSGQNDADATNANDADATSANDADATSADGAADAADATNTPDAADANDAAQTDAAPDANDAACTGPFDSDPHNCGSCGHDCLGGACVANQCQPVLLATAATPYATVVDDTRVYWANSDSDPGQILSVAKDGSDPQVVADGVHACHTLYINGPNIFWAEIDSPGRVFSAYRDGGNAVVLTQVGSNGPSSLVVDDTSVYVLDILEEPNVFQVPLAGEPDAGPPSILTTGGTYPLGLAEYGANLYWTMQGDANGELGSGAPFDGGVHGQIVSMPKDGSSAPTVVAGDLGQPLFVAVDGSGVYWTDSLTATVMALPAGSTVPVALATSLVQPYSLTIDGNNLYFSTIGVTDADGTIQRVPKNGSAPPVILVQNLAWPTQIAVDATAIYWGNTHGATVMKLAK
jgi:hypothetical protein